MPKFGRTSTQRLTTCDERLQAICHAVIPHYDFSIICGHRTMHDQNAAYHTGHSQLRYPQSKHNRWPSLAVDVAPWPIDWHDLGRFQHLAGRILQAGLEQGVPLVWGGNWTSFKDYPHFELQED